MKLLHCPACEGRVFFENHRCLACGTALGVDAEAFAMVALDDGVGPWVRCANAEIAGCNWVVPATSPTGALCRSCELTRTRPADGDAEGREWFLEAEAAKRRLVVQLLDIGLPVVSFADADHGLGFDLLSSHFDQVVTGHEDGIVTMDLAEADDAHRERVRHDLGEQYRTVLGHLRHEVGHHYWDVLVRDGGELEAFRACFGDERADYGEAMNAHYGGPSPTGWEDTHVSAYATMHPWEDWAETFAHLLHIRDALQTANESGVTVRDPDGAGATRTPGATDGDDAAFTEMVEEWLTVARALNELNRSMGAADPYPFVLAPTVIDKLAFADRLVRRAAAATTA